MKEFECPFCSSKRKNFQALMNHVIFCKNSPYDNRDELKMFIYEKTFGLNKDFIFNEYFEKENGLRNIERTTGAPYNILKFMMQKYGAIFRNAKECNDIVNKRNKMYFLETYGVENPFQIPEIIEKIQNKRNANKEEIYENLRKSLQNKYSVDNVFQLDWVKDKSKETSFEHWGVEYPIQNEIVQERAKETSRNHYGTDYPLQSEVVQKKIKETNQKRYGVNNVFQSQIIKDKIKEKLLQKYGCEYVLQIKSVIEKYNKTLFDRFGIEIHSGKISTIFSIPEKRKQKRKSSIHKKVCDFLNENSLIHCDEKPVEGFNVDIFIEPNKIIEIFGDFWHANPEKYEPEDIVSIPGTNGIAAITIWHNDAIRLAKINEKNQYEILVLWERDINKDFEGVKKLIWKLLKSKESLN
jgi:galactitol-specific phosphotransferase system IIB component